MSEHYFFSEEELADIRKAHDIRQQIDDLSAEMTGLLYPKAKRIRALNDVYKAEELMKLLPASRSREDLDRWIGIVKNKDW